MQIQSAFFKSANGYNDIAYYIFKPETEPKAILQISHGMCEYIKRYSHFAEFLTSNGILVCRNDHIGHGNSIFSEEDLGYFAPDEGWKFLTDDLHRMTTLIKSRYPDIPRFLFGHSMGSFVARAYMLLYGEDSNGAILCGTSGGNPLSGIGIAISNIVLKIKGDKHRSSLLERIAFADYNKKYKPKRTDKDWLTRETEIVDKYIDDKQCNFLFTTSAFKDLFILVQSVSNSNWAAKVPKDMPVLLMSGEMDPVGNYGKGVTTVFNRLKNAGVDDIEIKLYKECRHELVNETNKQEVFADVLNWLTNRI